jgi:hypothetical protein
MFRFINHISAVFVIVGPLFCSLGTNMSRAEEEVAFPLSGDIQGSEVLFDNQPVRILIGEIHGTSELPPLVAVLVRSLSLKAETVLCLEIAAREQPLLDAFLASDGGDDAVRALLSGPHWFMPDGRASTGGSY